ncbi:MAG TPA: DegV family protein [Aggregatilinea sp.]|uniref:DegV family protein n=1 Tax=Aggregatilinea sp. TaxID=2806333 RepID=UPI002BEBF50D|nr:DegV family protein [Aggregatilinea sp.]HML20063.1 DegV family protein [Aggregatilinea sp.]
MTARTALVTDSTSDLSHDLAAEKHIHVVPLYVLWGEETMRDGVDLETPDFYRMLEASEEIPKTSQASPQDFVDAFIAARETENADEVVCALISEQLSGTYASAIQAKSMVDFPVHVIDTQQTTWALGHAMLSGAEARDGGASPEEIADVIRQVAMRQRILFTVENLEYLRRGGRIGNARLLIGTALNIKPVLQLKDGVVASVDNVRARRRAMDRILAEAEAFAGEHPMTRVAVIHGNAESEAQFLLGEVKRRFAPDDLRIGYACMAIGVHTGPGVLGLIVERGLLD